MADYEEVAGEADEEDAPPQTLPPKERLYSAVLGYRQTDFQGLRDLAAALSSEQTQSLEKQEASSYPELEQLPEYLAKVRRLIARKKELERRREQVLRLKASLL